MICELPFQPFPYLEDPHRQTILSSVIGHWASEPPSTEKIISFPDGDRLSLQITTPKSWKPHDQTVLFIHGLCGSHRATYLVRMVKRLEPLGIRCVRINLRGCGSGKGLARHFYHSGKTDDILEILKVLKGESPLSPMTLIGYSLGANITLKLAGELQDEAKRYLEKVIAVSPPLDLHSTVKLFNKPENAFFERWFIRALRAELIFRHQTFEKDLPLTIPPNLKIIEFDDLFTAPRCGFTSAHDYYAKCSSGPFVPNIRLPCHILLAEDDPLICHSSLDGTLLPSNVQVFKTRKGGHLGFLGHPLQKGGFRWLDSSLEQWILPN